jgi:uncharacterized protein YuzE
MKLSYFLDTDSLYIELSDAPSTESREVSEGVVLDYDASGNLVGIDIDHASRKVDLTTVTLSFVPSGMPADRADNEGRSAGDPPSTLGTQPTPKESRRANSLYGFESFTGGRARVTNDDVDRIRDGMEF